MLIQEAHYAAHHADFSHAIDTLMHIQYQRQMRVKSHTRGRKLFALLATCSIVGGHWFVLQSIAWSLMLIDYTATYGVREGVVRTFDGEHPCEMCYAIQEAKTEELPTQSVSPTSQNVRLLAVRAAQTAVSLSFITSGEFLPALLTEHSIGRDRPPVPPPRHAHA